MSRAARAAPLFLLAILLLSWEAAVRLLRLPDFIIPPPSAVFLSLWFGFRSGIYPYHLWITWVQAVAGFAVALACGLAAGAVVAEIAVIRKALYPLVIAFQAMPKIALAPLVIIGFGYGIGSKIVLAAVIGFFPILVNTIAGLQDCDAGKIDVMKSLGASRWQIFRLVKLPNSLPYVFAGMHSAAGFVVLGAVVGEFVGARDGLGTLILIANGDLDAAQVFAILTLLGGLGFGFFAAVREAQRRLLRWAPLEAVPEG